MVQACFKNKDRILNKDLNMKVKKKMLKEDIKIKMETSSYETCHTEGRKNMVQN